MRFIFLQLILLGQLLVNAQSMKLIDQRNQKSYETILIGSQMWMAENLNTDRFNNGDVIYEAKTAEDWKKALDEEKPAWCYYNFDPKLGLNMVNSIIIMPLMIQEKLPLKVGKSQV
jgi:hypothetical protein